jgi:plasmid stability protein
MANTSEHITVRMPKELAERIRVRAADEGRSVSGMITRLVQFAMAGKAPKQNVITAARFEAELDYKCADPDEKDEAKQVLDARMAALDNLARNKHAPTCKCLMCKPPKS